LAGVPWLRDLATSRPGAVGVPDEHAVTAAIRGLLADLAVDGRVVVIIDDIHWADAASVRLLRDLLHGTPAPGAPTGCAYVVVERRPTNATGAWRDVDADTMSREELMVGRLTRDDCGDLLRSTMPFPVRDSFIDALHEASGGNCFVLESLAAMARRSPSPANAFLVELPQTATTIWADRFASLPADIVDVLSVAAVIGTAFETELLRAAAGDPDRVDAAIGDAHAVALVEPVDDSSWRFVHALLREHLYNRLTTTRRARVHRAVALTLEARTDVGPSDRSAQLAHHWRGSGRSGEWPTLVHSIAAARWAFQQGSRADSLAFAEEAVGLVDDLAVGADDERTAQLMQRRVQLGDLLLRIGHTAGFGVLRTAATYYEETGDVAVLAEIADALLRAGHTLGKSDFGTTLAESLVGRLDGVDPRSQSRVLARLARAVEGRVGADRFVADISEQALRLAREADDAETLAIALYCHAVDQPWTDARLEHGRELIALGEREHDMEYLLLGKHVTCTNLVARGDLAEAWSLVDELTELAGVIPAGYAGAVRNADLARVAEIIAVNQRTIRAQLLGRFDEQRHLIDQLYAYATEDDVERDRLVSIAVAQTGVLAFDQGELERFAELSIRFAREQPDTPQRQVGTAFVLAQVGWNDQAREFYDPVVADELRTVTVEQSTTFALALLAWTAYLLADPDGAAMIEERLAPFAGRNSCYFGGSVGPAVFSLGWCAAARGDDETASRRFEEAARQAERWGMPTYRARARLARAEALARLGRDLESARDDADIALQIAEELGMPMVARDARSIREALSGSQ
jgi:tetratricopeptide (TPR) repeat protein